ncbi:cysteine--tRNA ligase [Blattabacterium cuenoti]|uniref:cysteine--tRNA ligase n=1 Tax=Blattabacterium cuenoti TaxID=1653831 RepID=UPI00163C4281|nr:cysteine--tRNA ligase [Blattabacterium cuenoti]
MEYKNTAKNNLRIYNSLTGKKELFYPIHNDYVGIYVCGPTVYNHLHLGNCRTFILFDVVFRYFQHLGYKVRYVRNITDVGHLENNNGQSEDDKINKRSKIEGLEPMEIVQKYTISFHNILNTLNLLPPNIEPTATGHIIEQIDMVKDLINKKLAYEVNGSVYFNVRKYNKNYSYGILSRNNFHQLINKNLNFLEDKYYYQDFSIWKKVNPNHIMGWNSPWGKGIPGWHTECTVMSTKYLGKNFDIHGGGIDLKFPHHECEIAQAKSFYTTEKNSSNNLANYWMHTNMLTLDGKKMSKSKGNFIELRNLFLIRKKNDCFPNIIRFFVLQSHYRSILNFSEKSLLDAEKGFKKIFLSLNIINDACQNRFTKKNNNETSSSFDTSKWIHSCYQAINDDFNTPLLISLLFKVSNIVTDANEIEKISDIFLLKKYINHFFFEILGFKKEDNQTNVSKEKLKKLEILVNRLIQFRKEEREKKNWFISDKIRKELYNIGISLHDKSINK